MRTTAILLAAALALPATAYAQDAATQVGPDKGDWEFTLSGTGTSNNDFDDHTLGISGSIGRYVHNNVLVGGRQTVSYTDVEGSDDVWSGASRVFGDYVFNHGGKWRPYIGISFGGIYGEGVHDTMAAGPEVGIKYYADKHTFIFAQTEYQWTFDDTSDADNSASDGQFFHAIGVGMNF